MNFPSSFPKKTPPAISVEEFWNWFAAHAKDFRDILRAQRLVEKKFFRKLAQKMDEAGHAFSFMAGMCDAETAELIITADGDLTKIPLVEDFIAEAPAVEGWKFTALKQGMNSKDILMEMEGYRFNAENISFYEKADVLYPDEVAIAVVHNDLSEYNAQVVMAGTCIFLENYLGELAFRTQVDDMEIMRPQDAVKELIPISKLAGFLSWRQKELAGQYDVVIENTENDEHVMVEAESEAGAKLIAVVNNRLLSWDQKPSHPWIFVVAIEYSNPQKNGLPPKEAYQLLSDIQQQFMNELKDSDGYLNIGRQSAEGNREIYFACKEFRKPVRIAQKICKQYEGKQKINFLIYKDKYWRSFERFRREKELRGSMM